VGKSIIGTSSVTRVGLDLTKRVFRIHAVDATGSVVIARSGARARQVGERPRTEHDMSMGIVERRGVALQHPHLVHIQAILRLTSAEE
jgi:hypothetical protein